MLTNAVSNSTRAQERVSLWFLEERQITSFNWNSTTFLCGKYVSNGESSDADRGVVCVILVVCIRLHCCYSA